MCEEFDAIRLNFSSGSLDILNLTLAFIMFGVALNLKVSDFRLLVRSPRPALIGLVSQFLLLPAFTLILVWILEPCPSIALGMFLVASCPGGNVSNFMSLLAGGNVALSVSLSAVSTLASIVMTPLNFTFWAQWYAPAAQELQLIALDPWAMISTILLILGVPLVLGMLFARRFPRLTQTIDKPIRILSMLIFAGYILGALTSNWHAFVMYVSVVVGFVFLHNAVAMFGGYMWAWANRLDMRDRRTICIETGIQNSGLALVLIFGPVFEGRGGMAIIAALWGVWHLLAGMTMAWIWSRRPSEVKVSSV